MAFIEWSRSFEIGEESIDRQHKKLMDLINDVHDLVQDTERAQEIMHSLTSMFLYAREHFFDEEALMERHGYPERAAHAAMHQEFVAKTQSMADAFLDDCCRPEELQAFLLDWFRTHVGEEDAKLGRYLRTLPA